MRRSIPGGTVGALVPLLACLAATTVIAGEVRLPGVLIADRHSISAELSPDDLDNFSILLCEGETLTLSVKALRGSDLVPELLLYLPDGRRAKIEEHLRRAGTPKPLLKSYPVPADESGMWRVVVQPSEDGHGEYSVKVKIRQQKPPRPKGLTVPAGETVTVPFTARDGASVTALVKERDGPELAVVRLLDPTGEEVPGSAAAFVRKKRKLSAKKFAVAEGCGAYAFEMTGDPDASTTVDVKLKVKYAKPVKRRETLPPEAQVTSADPASLIQGTSGAAVTLYVTNLVVGTQVEIEGTGVSMEAPVVGDEEVDLVLSVEPTATLGPRTLMLYPPPDLGEPFSGELAVHAPPPTVTAVSGSPVHQEDQGVAIEITGTNFRSGGVVSVSGTGVEVTNTQLLSDSSARAWVSVFWDAPLGLRNVTYRQPEIGGGASGTLYGVLDVVYPVPNVERLTKLLLLPGDEDEEITVYGTRFRPGMEVSCTDGISVGGLHLESKTEFRITVSVDEGAEDGNRSLVCKQSPSHGGETSTRTDALRVDTGYRLYAAAGASGDEFGHDVAASGDTIAVSAPGGTGSVYVFVRDQTGWVQEARLESNDPEIGDRFGESIALDGDLLVVGSPGEDQNDSALFAFTRSSGVWTGERIAHGAKPGAQLGHSVDLDGSTLVAGAPEDRLHALEGGAAYVFIRQAGVWYQKATLPGSAEEGDLWGESVAVSGSTILLASPGAETVEVWELKVGWELQGELEPPAGEGREFAAACALDGDIAAVSAPRSKVVHAYVMKNEGWIFKETMPRTHPESASRPTAVAACGDFIAVGDISYAWPVVRPPGAAILHRRISPIWPAVLEWWDVGRVVGDEVEISDEFGHSVDVTESRMIVGAPNADGATTNTGAVFVFELP